MWGTSALYKNRRLGRLPPRALTLRTNAANFFALGFGDLSALALRSSAWSNGKAPPVFAIPISVFFFCCCIFFSPLPSSFPLPLCPSAPRTVSSRGEKKPGVNGNQPRRPLAVSPPRKTGRRQELSVPLSCLCPMGVGSHRDPFQSSTPTGCAVPTAPTQGANSAPGDLRAGAGMGRRLHVFTPRWTSWCQTCS